MDGPTFQCAYLGFSTVSKPPTSINSLQTTFKDLYLKYRKVGIGGRTSSLKITQTGILVSVFENNALNAELFFNFGSVIFVEAVKFVLIKTSSERKPKAIFVPADESKGPVTDKLAFPLDKSLHFLVSAAHPPLVACVVRRPTGVKALDCHMFALDTIENALHIAAIILSTQSPTPLNSPRGMPGGVPQGVMVGVGGGGEVGGLGGGGGGGGSGFVDPRNDGSFNRLTRRDVIRTDHGDYSIYRGSQNYEPHGQPPSNFGGQIPLPNRGVPVGGIMLPTANAPPVVSSSQQFVGQGHGLGGFEHRGENGSGSSARRPNLGDSGRQFAMEDQRRSVLEKRHSTGSDQSSGGYRHDNSRVLKWQAKQSFDQVPPDLLRHQAPPTSRESMMSRPHSTALPVGVSDFEQGPVFSASSRENRELTSNVDEAPQEPVARGKPVAKVPPHLKAGIKVLPSDFRMVKLKHKSEKRSESLDDSVYDNNNEIMAKYKALQEQERDLLQQQETGEVLHKDYNYRNETEANGRNSTNYDAMLRNGSSTATHSHGQNANRNRFSAPVYQQDSNAHWSGGVKSQDYIVEAADDDSESQGSSKEKEIASMFSNMRFSKGANGGYPPHQRQRNDFEEGLGYLP